MRVSPRRALAGHPLATQRQNTPVPKRRQQGRPRRRRPATPRRRNAWGSFLDTFGRCEGGESTRRRPPRGPPRRNRRHSDDGADGQRRPPGWPRRQRQAAPSRRNADPGPGTHLEGTEGPWANGGPPPREHHDEITVRGSDGDGGLRRAGKVFPGPRDSGGRPRRPSPRSQTSGGGARRDESTWDDRIFARDNRAGKGVCM